MAKAIWNGVLLAESEDFAHVEGNAYFPKICVNWGYFRKSNDSETFCHWKGFASYLDIVAGGEVTEGAAWEYPSPYKQASLISDRIAFWKDVEVEGTPDGRGLVEPTPSQRDKITGWEALCWLLRHPPKSELSAADVQAGTNLTPYDFETAWQQRDVKRYAKRYRWTLECGSSDAPIRLIQAPGGPVKVF